MIDFARANMSLGVRESVCVRVRVSVEVLL